MRLRMPAAVLLVGWLASCGGNSPMTPTNMPLPAGTISIVPGASGLTSNAYSPNQMIVGVGATVTWINNDSVTHTATADGGLWDSGRIDPGGRFSVTFSTAGTFPYHCTIHPNMVGSVIVQ